jgi:hypothetical protein
MSTVSRIAVLALAAVTLLPQAASAAAKPFAGVAGWDHTVSATPTPALPRDQESWKNSNGETVSILSDGALSYDDTIASVKKNFADNGMHPNLDKDRTCDGRRAHELELVIGTSVIHQIIVDDAPGLTKLSYTRAQGAPLAPSVASAITAYCGP